MTNISALFKSIIFQLLRNPTFLIVFSVWFATVLAEIGYVEFHPVVWFRKHTLNQTEDTKGLQEFSKKIKKYIHKVLIITGLAINVFFLRNSNQIKAVNLVLIFYIFFVPVPTDIFFKFILIILGEFLYCSISDNETKFYVLVTFAGLIYFEKELLELIKHNGCFPICGEGENCTNGTCVNK